MRGGLPCVAVPELAATAVTCQEAILDVIAGKGPISHDDLIAIVGEDGYGYTLAETGAALMALTKDGEIRPADDAMSSNAWLLTGWHLAPASSSVAESAAG
jgi:hypothetical protein